MTKVLLKLLDREYWHPTFCMHCILPGRGWCGSQRQRWASSSPRRPPPPPPRNFPCSCSNKVHIFKNYRSTLLRNLFTNFRWAILGIGTSAWDLLTWQFIIDLALKKNLRLFWYFLTDVNDTNDIAFEFLIWFISQELQYDLIHFFYWITNYVLKPHRSHGNQTSLALQITWRNVY